MSSRRPLGFYVYGLYDSTGRLCYVGQTGRPHARELHHKTRWPELELVLLFGPQTRPEALSIEAQIVAFCADEGLELLNRRCDRNRAGDYPLPFQLINPDKGEKNAGSDR